MKKDSPDTLRVLHLFSNSKWTGPAEPALNLCIGLRALGVHADFACAPNAGASVNKVAETARDRVLAQAIDRVRAKYGPKSVIPGTLAPREE